MWVKCWFLSLFFDLRFVSFRVPIRQLRSWEIFKYRGTVLSTKLPARGRSLLDLIPKLKECTGREDVGAPCDGGSNACTEWSKEKTWVQSTGMVISFALLGMDTRHPGPRLRQWPQESLRLFAALGPRNTPCWEIHYKINFFFRSESLDGERTIMTESGIDCHTLEIGSRRYVYAWQFVSCGLVWRAEVLKI